jgi:hypothetical protein
MNPETAEHIRRDVAMTNSHRESPQDVTDPRPTQQRGPAPAVPVSALRALQTYDWHPWGAAVAEYKVVLLKDLVVLCDAQERK